ncbi:MAG TPA: Fe-S cluster assembly protein HesB [Glaciihabitans sp.]|nr:Fe-S cluster assembly protein HesB [Glaciihabitans sp.]
MTLTLTDQASTVVKAISERSVGTDTAGLRISGAEDGGTDYSVAIAPDAQPTDTVIESDGARVFLDATAAAALNDNVLDAQVNDDGSVRFAIGAQG